jgi:triacylglycerol esterase/lipase EstA (alpha/beta hydrolase family)
MLKLKATLIVATVVGVVGGMALPAGAGAELPVPYEPEGLVAFTNGELLSPARVAGANGNCKPTAQHPYPVVLVHGTVEDLGSNWVTLAPLLANNGYCVYALNYGEGLLSLGRADGIGDIAHSAGELAGFVNSVLAKTGASKVDIVGHSQGGMMPNYFIKFLGGASKVHTLIGLAPSNHGTTINGLRTLLSVFPVNALLGGLSGLIGDPALEQQEEGSAFMKKLFAGGDTVAGPRYVVIETTHDEVVTPYTNAFLNGPNVTNITVQNQCPTDPVAHIGVFDDSPILQNVLNQLSAAPSGSFQAACEKYGATI